MNKDVVNNWILYFVFFLIIASALGYLLVPSLMLGVVGITGTEESNFMARALSAALLAMTPAIFAIINNVPNNSVRWYVVFGLAMYMILSSMVDLYGFINDLVNNNSVPSIVFRVFIGLILLITNQKQKNEV